MSRLPSLLHRVLHAIRAGLYILRHGEEDMVAVYGRNPGGEDNEALRLGSANIAAAIANPGGGSM